MPFTHPRDFEALNAGAQPDEKGNPTVPAHRPGAFVKGLIAGAALAAGAAVALPAMFVQHTPAPPTKPELAKQAQQSPPKRDVTPRSAVAAADPARNAPPLPDATRPPQLVTAPPPLTNAPPRSESSAAATGGPAPQPVELSAEPTPPRDSKATGLLGGPEPTNAAIPEKLSRQAKAPAEDARAPTGEIKAPVVARTEQPEARPAKKPKERRATQSRRSGESRRYTERRRTGEERRYSGRWRERAEPREVIQERRGGDGPRMGGMPFGFDRMFSGGRDRDAEPFGSRRSVLRDHPGFGMGGRGGPFGDD